MNRRRISTVLSALAAISIGLTAHAQSAAPVTATSSAKAMRESLLTADRALSKAVRARGLSAGFGDALAANALFLYEGAPIISGRANVLTFLDAQPALKTVRVQWVPVVVEVSSDETFGATYGVTTISPAPGQPDSALRFAKYISTWRRKAAGAWELAAYVEMGLAVDKGVIPPNLTPSSRPGNPASGPGAAFATADIEFARMAAAQGAPAAFGAFVAPNGATLPATGEIVMGPPAITARMLESPAATGKWEWHPIFAEGSASGDLGFTVGEATIGIPGANGVTDYHSKYLTVWKKQRDGTMRFLVDGGNGR